MTRVGASGRASRKCSFGVLATLLSLAFVGCSSSPPRAPISAESVATNLQPPSDGYSFPNFSAKKSSEEFSSDDLAYMFGSEACTGGVASPCEPIAEAAVWAQMVNQARQSGHCEGMVVRAATRFLGGESPRTVDLLNEGQVTHEIIRSFATQFFDNVQDEANRWAKSSVSEIVGELTASFKRGALDYTLGIYTEDGGHAVLPYAVEAIDPTTVRIHVYDSNWPGKDRFVTADLGNDTWSFSFSGADPNSDPDMWTGGNGDLDMVSFRTRQEATCPFCQSGGKVRNSFIVIRSTDNDWSIRTPAGTFTPRGPDVDGVQAFPIRSAFGLEPSDYVVFFDNSSQISLKFPSPVSAFVVTKTAISQILSNVSNNSEVLIGSNSVAVNDEDIQITVAKDDLIASVASASSEVRIDESTLTASASTSGGREVVEVVNPGTPQVEIRPLSSGSSNALIVKIGRASCRERVYGTV